MPSRIARRLVAPAVPGLLRSHPALRLTLSSTDRAVDLVQEGVDRTVRVGSLNDSNLLAQPLGRIAMINCASPGYLREHGVPEHPDDLADRHLCIGYASPTTGRELQWEYLFANRVHYIPVTSRVIVNNAENYISCCCAGDRTHSNSAFRRAAPAELRRIGGGNASLQDSANGCIGDLPTSQATVASARRFHRMVQSLDATALRVVIKQFAMAGLYFPSITCGATVG